ncbi:MAG: class I SAM-dependent methyltransferase [Cyclobacteriaceae bacterium]
MIESKSKMIEVNKEQADFYSKKIKAKRNLIYWAWDRLRKNGFWKFRKFLGIDQHVEGLHTKWLDGIKNKTVLDLGCGGGNLLSPYLAEHAKEYVAIDLSEPLINHVREKLRRQGINRGEFITDDFLTYPFDSGKFDVIYAFGVIHHFKDLDVLMERLQECLSNDGIIITYDPTNTRLITKIVRGFYRPFQPDADWEFPFTNQTFEVILRKFKLVASQGYFGSSVWMFPLYFLFPNSKIIQRASLSKHKKDIERLCGNSKLVRKALNVSLLLSRR